MTLPLFLILLVMLLGGWGGGCITCRGGHGYFLEAHITVLTNCGFTSTDFVKMVMSG